MSPRRRRRAIVVSSVATLLVIVGGLVAQAGHALVIHRSVLHPQAILSLGSHEWERLPLAARLAADHPDALVLLTEPQTVSRFNCHECAHRVERLRTMGVAEGRVRMLPITGSGTHGEAHAALAFARDAGIERLVIVTSPYHTRRSLAVFRTVFAGSGVEIGIEPAGVEPPIQPSLWWLAPYDRAYVPYEWAAIVYYWWEYGVPVG